MKDTMKLAVALIFAASLLGCMDNEDARFNQCLNRVSGTQPTPAETVDACYRNTRSKKELAV